MPASENNQRIKYGKSEKVNSHGQGRKRTTQAYTVTTETEGA